MSSSEISFGDRVRVRATPETEQSGHADLVGQVYGFTTPSVTAVTVVGGQESDQAFNVHFDDRAETVWFAPHLLEFVDHSPGTDLAIGNKRWVRDADGSWLPQQPVQQSPGRRPWWKLW